MKTAVAAALIAIAFTAGNIAAPSASTILKQSATGVQPAAGLNLQAKPFTVSCVNNLQKYDEKKTNVAGVPVISSYSCRTNWIECPDFPAFPQELMAHDVKKQGGKIRFTYTCTGFFPAG